jgi:hypothetical protein
MKATGIKLSSWAAAAKRPVLLMFYGAVLAATVVFLLCGNLEISLIIKMKG